MEVGLVPRPRQQFRTLQDRLPKVFFRPSVYWLVHTWSTRKTCKHAGFMVLLTICEALARFFYVVTHCAATRGAKVQHARLFAVPVGLRLARGRALSTLAGWGHPALQPRELSGVAACHAPVRHPSQVTRHRTSSSLPDHHLPRRTRKQCASSPDGAAGSLIRIPAAS